MEIGVLALQGDFAKHGEMLTRMGVNWREVRTAADLTGIDGLIIPGGESTTMLKLMREEGLFEPLQQFTRTQATFGTCAGAILLARDVRNPAQASLQAIDISIERNAYGRQVDSFTDQANIGAVGAEPIELVFIRAPRIAEVGVSAEVLASHRNDPVLVRQGNILVATFHPELTQDSRIHQLFIEMVAARQQKHQEAAQ